MLRLVVFGVCLVIFLVGALNAPALEVKDKSKAPLGWWDATNPMAIPPQYFDQVLSAYGLTMQDASKCPPTYARKEGDKVVFESPPRTYTPAEMDQILQAYGATLGDVSKAPPTYATTVDAKTVFGTGPIAWGPQVINSILVAYVVK